MNFKKIISEILAISLALSILLTGCSSSKQTSSKNQNSSSSTNNTTSGSILIGVSTGLTGSFAADGEKVKDGVLLAIDEINKQGGVLGKKLEATFEDDQDNPTMAVNTVNKLIGEHVVALIGPTLSATVMPVSSIVQKYKVPTLTGATSPKLLTMNNPYLFMIRASDSITAKVAATFAVQNLKAKKIGILYNSDEMGTGAKGVIEDYLKSIGIPFVSEGHNTGDKDMTGQLTKMKNAGVDTLMVWTHDQEAAVIMRQIKELNLKVNVVGNPGFAMPQELNLMDKDWVEGVYTATDIVTDDPNTVVQDFVKKFNDRYHTLPDLYASAYYSAVKVLADAIKRAGSTDSDKISEALRQTKDFKTPEGTYTTDSSGALLHECIIAQIKDKTPHAVTHVSVK
jgi:branched-chain amino acid transport system substrate-binding protein